jgi:hypothetical protein
VDHASCFTETFEELAAGDDASPDSRSDAVGRI